MNRPSADAIQAMHAASSLLQAQKYTQACTVLEKVLAGEPQLVEAHRLLAGARQMSGDLVGAERALRAALAIAPDWAPTLVSFGELLAQLGRIDEAEQALRKAFAAGGNYPRAATSLTRFLLSMDRAEDMLNITTPAVAGGRANLDLMTQHAEALMRLQRHDEALATYRRIVQAAPANGAAEFNLAAALENAGLHGEAQAAIRRAQSKGFDAPELWLVLGTASLGMDHHADAETAFREAIRRRPVDVNAHRELAQLIWMRTADAQAASSDLDTALQRYPEQHALLIVKANLLQSTSGPEAAYAAVADAVARADANPALIQVACDAALKFDANIALSLAERIAKSSPQGQRNGALIYALLGVGRAEEALRLNEQALAAAPDNQHTLALQATAWRMLGDARYRELYDYENLVRTWTIDTPAGWSDLKSYLVDLAISLRRMHTLRTHPIAQSLRHGTQTTQNLMHSDDPAIRAFFGAIDGPLRRHIAALGNGNDPLRRRRRGGYKIQGIWSVQLGANGYHTNHVHPLGWLSSACYIDLPDVIAGENRQGWLKFGEPGLATQPRLAPEYFVKPSPGFLALFPSYMWHGTVPFTGTQTRLTIAFDAVPA